MTGLTPGATDPSACTIGLLAGRVSTLAKPVFAGLLWAKRHCAFAGIAPASTVLVITSAVATARVGFVAVVLFIYFTPGFRVGTRPAMPERFRYGAAVGLHLRFRLRYADTPRGAIGSEKCSRQQQILQAQVSFS